MFPIKNRVLISALNKYYHYINDEYLQFDFANKYILKLISSKEDVVIKEVSYKNLISKKKNTYKGSMSRHEFFEYWEKNLKNAKVENIKISTRINKKLKTIESFKQLYIDFNQKDVIKGFEAIVDDFENLKIDDKNLSSNFENIYSESLQNNIKSRSIKLLRKGEHEFDLIWNKKIEKYSSDKFKLGDITGYAGDFLKKLKDKEFLASDDVRFNGTSSKIIDVISGKVNYGDVDYFISGGSVFKLSSSAISGIDEKFNKIKFKVLPNDPWFWSKTLTNEASYNKYIESKSLEITNFDKNLISTITAKTSHYKNLELADLFGIDENLDDGSNNIVDYYALGVKYYTGAQSMSHLSAQVAAARRLFKIERENVVNFIKSNYKKFIGNEKVVFRPLIALEIKGSEKVKTKWEKISALSKLIFIELWESFNCSGEELFIYLTGREVPPSSGKKTKIEEKEA